MQQSALYRFRNTLRSIPLIYQAYGFLRRIEHEVRLRIHTSKFNSGSGLAHDGQPVPPPKLRFRVHGDLAEKSFMAGGSMVSEDIGTILSKYSTGLDNCGEYLDFGCGCARVLRHFFLTSKGVKFSGTDIDSEAIAWNSKHFGQAAHWGMNDAAPPTSYRNDQFDVIVSISVFTHLDEELQYQWLAEIERILSPGGVAILTVHGDSVWKSYPNIVGTMQKVGFKFLKNYVGFWRFDGLPEFYQVTFHSEDYIHRNWTRFFDIVAYEEAAIGGHQSAVVVRKRAPATSSC